MELVWVLKTPVLTEALQAIPLRGGSASKDECGPVASGLSFSEKRLCPFSWWTGLRVPYIPQSSLRGLGEVYQMCRCHSLQRHSPSIPGRCCAQQQVCVLCSHQGRPSSLPAISEGGNHKRDAETTNQSPLGWAALVCAPNTRGGIFGAAPLPSAWCFWRGPGKP